jgi:hypothetical protein
LINAHFATWQKVNRMFARQLLSIRQVASFSSGSLVALSEQFLRVHEWSGTRVAGILHIRGHSRVNVASKRPFLAAAPLRGRRRGASFAQAAVLYVF